MVPLCEVPYLREEWHVLQKQLRLRSVQWKEQQLSFLGTSTVWVHEAKLARAREAVSESERLFAKLRARQRRLESRPPASLRDYWHWLRRSGGWVALLGLVVFALLFGGSALHLLAAGK
jgi:hypothetical protein